MAAKIVSTEEFRKRFGRRGTTISTISPEEFARRWVERSHKLKAERLAREKAEAEVKALATSTTEQ